MLFCLFVPMQSEGRMAWRHQDVWLKNERGERITPARNSFDAYSPRRTCGGCHGYFTITRGSHFQRGFKDLGSKPAGSLPGIYGTGLHPAAFPAAVAGKVNRDARLMGLSVYDWISVSGRFLPGGGPLEYGRASGGRPDTSKRLSEAEGLKWSALDGDYSSRFAPGGRSRFRESGVLEGDCLICHQAAYRMGDRNRQIRMRNYRWAAAAGAGIGDVRGSIYAFRDSDADITETDDLTGKWNFSHRPVVHYRWRDPGLFTREGKLSGSIVQRSVPSRNCLQCHQGMWAVSRGSLYSPRRDAHAQGQLQCVDCHPLSGKTSRERLRHQITKNNRTCSGCHIDGLYKPARRGMPPTAKNPSKTHAEKFPRGSFHFLIIQCAGCHITAQPAKGGYLLDEAAGHRFWYTADDLTAADRWEDLTAPAREPWKPWITRIRTGKSSDEMYAPHVPLARQWFGEKTAGGEIRPINLAFVRQAVGKVKGLTTVEVSGRDGRKLKRQTVSAKEDIAAVLRSLASMGFRNPVFVSDKLYELKGGRVASSEGRAAVRALSYPLRHGVVPLKTGKTYGAKGGSGGCLDCHSDSAPFFMKMNVLNIGGFLKEDYPEPKEPNAEPQMSAWGLTGVPSYE
jgi:hypothetical protein